MIGTLERAGRRLLFAFDPETAHGLSIKALKSGIRIATPARADPRLAVSLRGLSFSNPLGMAAGYDKNADVPDALLGLGFGFVEVGSITPKPQAGNPRPRIFRLIEDDAVINRLGFNNDGHEACAARLVARRGKAGIVGVNIGANKDSADRAGDYEAGIGRFAPLASYLTVNVSSPNTPGLRKLQARDELAALLERVAAARASALAPGNAPVPVFLKIAPDLSEADLADIAAEIRRSGIDGVIVSNTTLARQGLRNRSHAGEVGGLSGRPLFERSTAVLARMRRLLGPDMALIGVGGVDSAEAAMEKIRAGADLVQLYTGMIFGGPLLPARIIAGMSAILDRERAAAVRMLRDTRLDFWAGKPL